MKFSKTWHVFLILQLDNNRHVHVHPFSVGGRVRPRFGRDSEHLFVFDETGQRAQGDQGGRDSFEGREGRQRGGEEEEGLRP